MAHNSHIGNAAATTMGSRGELNSGQQRRTLWSRAAALIGMVTDRSQVAGADD